MENQTQDQTTPTPPQPVVPLVSPVFPKKNNFVVILLSIFLVITLLISGYLFLQVQGLTKQLARSQVLVQATPISSPAEASAQEGTANWKTYNNDYYSFRIDYPGRFEIAEKIKREDYYDTLATLTSQFKESITLRAIHDIDIYKDNKPEMIAEREIMDSGFKYNITTTKIGDYFAAITTFDNNLDKKSPTITIAHPNKNLFIVVDINADLSRVEFDQILSTFRFLK